MSRFLTPELLEVEDDIREHRGLDRESFRRAFVHVVLLTEGRQRRGLAGTRKPCVIEQTGVRGESDRLD